MKRFLQDFGLTMLGILFLMGLGALVFSGIIIRNTVDKLSGATAQAVSITTDVSKRLSNLEGVQKQIIQILQGAQKQGVSNDVKKENNKSR